MKAKISITVLLFILLTSLITVMGQEQTDKKKQEAEAQKKKDQVTVITDAKKEAQLNLQKVMEESLVAEEKALKARQERGYYDARNYKELWNIQIQDNNRQLEELKKQGLGIDPAIVHSFTVPPMRYKFNNSGMDNVYSMYRGDRENNSMSISKTLEDVTFATDFSYDVKNESSQVSFYVSGTLKAGELKITLKKPDKSSFQEITISPLADVNWNQQFSWEEDEAGPYLGKWIISISASKANGNYRVQVNSR